MRKSYSVLVTCVSLLVILSTGTQLKAQIGTGTPIPTPQIKLEAANGLIGNPQAVSSGQTLGEINATGFDGIGYSAGATIRFQADTNPIQVGNISTRMSFLTGGATLAERMAILNNGRVGIGDFSLFDPFCILHVFDNPIESSIAIGNTPNGISGKLRLFCDPGAGSDVASNDINVNLNPLTGVFTRQNDLFGAWCMPFQVNNDGTARMEISFAEPGTGPINWLPRLAINETGNVGINNGDPQTTLDIVGDPILTDLNIGRTPNGISGTVRTMCDFTNASDILMDDINVIFDTADFFLQNPTFGAWCTPRRVNNDGTGSFTINWSPPTPGPITWMPRLTIDELGNMGIRNPQPISDLDVLGADPTFAEIGLGLTPNGITANQRTWCPGTSDVARTDINLDFDPATGISTPQNPGLSSWCVGSSVSGVPIESFFDIAFSPIGLPDMVSRFRIDNEGNVGIGTQTPASDLDIQGDNGLLSEMGLGLTPNGIRSNFRTFCDTFIPFPSDVFRTDINIDFDPVTNTAFRQNPDFNSWCISTSSTLDGIGSSFDIMLAMPDPGMNPVITNFQNVMTINELGNTGLGIPFAINRLEVDGDVAALNFIPLSDRKIKKDISNIDGALEKVLALRGVTYYFDQEAYPERNFNDRLQYGFVAQEVEEVIPELVAQAGANLKGVHYDGVIPLLTEAIAEQQEIINTQQEQLNQQAQEIAALKELFEQAGLLEKTHAEGIGANAIDIQVDGTQLFANQPNPTNDITEIPYFLAEGAFPAELKVFDMRSGEAIHTFSISETGFGKVRLDTHGLAEGVYVYTLSVNGLQVSSKTMVVAR